MKEQHHFSGSLFLFRFFLFPLFLLAVLISPSPPVAAEEGFYYHNDAVGSPVAMTDGSGAVVWQADYQSFGEEWNLSESEPNTHRFTGKERDSETGLHYFGARYYDASLGRFISIDPALISGRPASTLIIPQQHNFYAYAINNPYRYVDPNGEFAITAAIVLGAIVTNTFLPSTVNAPLDDQALINSQTGMEFAVGAAVIETGGLVTKAVGGKILSRVASKGKNIFTKSTIPVVKSARVKIETLAQKFGTTSDEILSKGLKGNRFSDLKHKGNIDIFSPRLDGKNGFMRITLDPKGDRVISAGLNQVRNVKNGIEGGRFIPFD